MNTHVEKAVLVLLAGLAAGCVRQRCYDNRDCPTSQICASGACVRGECDDARPCGSGFTCTANRCTPPTSQLIVCPVDMVGVADAFCADKYEASRPDATADDWGKDSARAMSVAGVLPWNVADNATAASACGAAGKRLCTADEWRLACKGPDGTAYSYGDTYDPFICNGIEAFGRTNMHLAPTGSFSGCTNEWGLFDINGNIWEHVAGGNDTTVRGGAFNCLDPSRMHACDYVPGNWTPAARGFRCCLTPGGSADGGGVAGDTDPTSDAEAGAIGVMAR